MSMQSPLHQAAAILIPTASEVTVRAVLRLLLDDAAEPAPVRRSAAERVEQRAPDPAWNELRQAVRRAMKERGMGCDALAERLGVSPTTLRVQLGRTKPATRPLEGKLRAWLAAPAVAVPEPTFRGGTPVRRGNAGNGMRASGAGHRPDGAAGNGTAHRTNGAALSAA